MNRLLPALAASALLLALPGFAQDSPPVCFTNEACGAAAYCACFRHRNEVIGDCDEMGGICRRLASPAAPSAREVDAWAARKRRLRERYGMPAESVRPR